MFSVIYMRAKHRTRMVRSADRARSFPCGQLDPGGTEMAAFDQWIAPSDFYAHKMCIFGPFWRIFSNCGRPRAAGMLVFGFLDIPRGAPGGQNKFWGHITAPSEISFLGPPNRSRITQNQVLAIYFEQNTLRPWDFVPVLGKRASWGDP